MCHLGVSLWSHEMSCYFFSPSILMLHVRFFIGNVTPKCSFILFVCRSIAVFESYRGLYFCANLEIFMRLSESIKLSVNQSEAHFSLFNLGFSMVFFYLVYWNLDMCSPMWIFIILWLEDTSVLRIVFSFGQFSHGLEQFFSILALNINDLEIWNFSGE